MPASTLILSKNTHKATHLRSYLSNTHHRKCVKMFYLSHVGTLRRKIITQKSIGSIVS